MHVEFEPYHRSEILHGHLHLGGSNPGGERIEVNSLCLTRGGQPWLPVMGEFHFSRCDPAQWQTELCKMKAGGVTMVSTYLFWIHHEEREGELRFSGRLDVRRFVLCCRRAGLDVVLRIGPWAHGECRNGGFPDWLLHKGIPLRQNHPAYLALVRAWYRSIYRQVRGLLYRDGGPIVGIQLENELVDNSDHLAALKRIAVEEGFEVPLYTVTGWNAVSGARIPTAEVLPVFAAYPDAPWTQHRDPLPLSPQYLFNPTRNDTAVGADLLHTAAPDGWQLPYDRYPFATCEIGAGQQSTYHRRVRISGMDAYALSLVKLGCGNNLIGYYMYHGGTNPIGRDSTLQESRATGYPNDYPILNYDFATALSQYGETRPQYRWLNLLHLLAADFGRELARMEYVSSLTHPTADTALLSADGRNRRLRLCQPSPAARGALPGVRCRAGYRHGVFPAHHGGGGPGLPLPVRALAGRPDAALGHRPADLPVRRYLVLCGHPRHPGPVPVRGRHAGHGRAGNRGADGGSGPAGHPPARAGALAAAARPAHRPRAGVRPLRGGRHHPRRAAREFPVPAVAGRPLCPAGGNALLHPGAAHHDPLPGTVCAAV